MLPQNRVPTHPGKVLLEEFLKPLKVSQPDFAARLGIPLQHLSEIVQGRRDVTPEIVLGLSRALGTTPDFWMNLQNPR